MLSALSLITEKTCKPMEGEKHRTIVVSKIVPHKQNTIHLCSIRFRKDLQAEAERKKKQNRKDSDPPGGRLEKQEMENGNGRWKRKWTRKMESVTELSLRTCTKIATRL